MTETTRFVSKSTALLLLLLVSAIVVLLVWAANNQYQHEVTRGCMERLTEPDPGAPNYHQEALLFASDVRECMRG
jgi:hypothetical protein